MSEITIPKKPLRKGTVVDSAYVIMRDNWITENNAVLEDKEGNIYNVIRCQHVKTLKNKYVTLLELDKFCPTGTVLFVSYEIYPENGNV